MAHVARRKVAGLLLAGGKSERMGTDKALLPFDGKPMIAWCAAALASCAPTLVVASSSGAHAARCARAVKEAWPRFTVLRGVEVETAVDAPGAQGPLAGFVAGCALLETEGVVVSACDTPLAPPEFYRRAVGLLDSHEVVAPQLDAPEPLISAWRRAPALEKARPLLAKGKGPRALLEALSFRPVPLAELEGWGVAPERLASANTKESLERLLTLHRGPSMPR